MHCLTFVTLQLAQLVFSRDVHVFFAETFDNSSWESRWVQVDLPGINGPAARFEWSAGDWFVNDSIQRGLRTSTPLRHYAASARFQKFSNRGKDLVLQFSVKHENEDLSLCAGGYVKLLHHDFDQSTFGGTAPYQIMFGPDICGYDVSVIHLIFNWKGRLLHRNPEISLDFDERDSKSHIYTLLLSPDNTYKIYIDLREKSSGKLHDFWDFPKMTIDDPTDRKPKDWIEHRRIVDPEVKKPEPCMVWWLFYYLYVRMRIYHYFDWCWCIMLSLWILIMFLYIWLVLLLFLGTVLFRALEIGILHAQIISQFCNFTWKSIIMNSKSEPRRIGWKISLFQTPLLRNLSSGMMRRMVLLLPHWWRTLYTKVPGFLPKWTIPSFVVNGNHGNVEILSMKKKFMLIRIWEQLDWNFGQYMRVPFSTTFWFVILGNMPKGKPWNCKRFWWKSLKHEENGRKHMRSRKLQITFALSIYDGKPKEGWGQWSWNVYKTSERKQRYEMKKFRSHVFSQSWVQHASAGCNWCKKLMKVLEWLKIKRLSYGNLRCPGSLLSSCQAFFWPSQNVVPVDKYTCCNISKSKSIVSKPSTMDYMFNLQVW